MKTTLITGCLVGSLLLVAGCSTVTEADRGGDSSLTSVQRQAECMEEHGFEATVDSDGGISYEGPAEQEDLFRKAFADCQAESGFGEPATETVTSAMWEKLYAKQREIAACLTREGYSISTAPSLESFVESKGAWVPHSELPIDLPESEWDRLNDVCPQPQQADF